MLSSFSPFHLVLDPNPAEGTACIYGGLPISVNLLWERPQRYAQASISVLILNSFTLAMKSNPHRSCVLKKFILHNNAVRTTQRGKLRPRGQNERLKKTPSRNGDKRKRWAKSEYVWVKAPACPQDLSIWSLPGTYTGLWWGRTGRKFWKKRPGLFRGIKIQVRNL